MLLQLFKSFNLSFLFAANRHEFIEWLQVLNPFGPTKGTAKRSEQHDDPERLQICPQAFQHCWSWVWVSIKDLRSELTSVITCVSVHVYVFLLLLENFYFLCDFYFLGDTTLMYTNPERYVLPEYNGLNQSKSLGQHIYSAATQWYCWQNIGTGLNWIHPVKTWT